MKRMRAVAGLGVAFLLLMSLWPVQRAWADSAEVLPKGIWRTGVSGNFWLPIDERFDPDGDTEDVAADFNTPIDSLVVPDLAGIETAFGMPPGSASLGQSVVSFEYRLTDVIYDLQYGVTDKLTVGIHIPYWFQKNEVDARVDTATATVGVNPAFGTPGDPYGSPLIPVDAGGIRDDDLATEVVQSYLEAGLGYERIETWSDSGVSDIDVGLRYQYLQNKTWRLAFTGGVRIPTGEEDDPDNLVDLAFGTGAWGLLFQSQNDYLGFGKLVLNATARYDLLLPDSQTLRILEDVNRPVTPVKESVDRNLGDKVELEVSGQYELSPGFTASLLYRYVFGLKDDVSGDGVYDYSALEDETDITEHIAIAGLSYSTLPLYLDKKFPVPLTVFGSFRDRFAGTNNVLNSSYVTLGVEVLF